MAGTGSSGRRPDPRGLRLLKGTKPSRMNPDEPELETVAELPDPPSMLNKSAKAIWQEEGPEMLAKGVLTVADLGTWADYCHLKAEQTTLIRRIRHEGRVLTNTQGNKYRNPNTTILREVRQDLHRLRLELGLTPAARTKVKAIKPAKAPNKFDDI